MFCCFLTAGEERQPGGMRDMLPCGAIHRRLRTPASVKVTDSIKLSEFGFIFNPYLTIHLLISGRKGERNINWLPPGCAPTGDWTHNLAMGGIEPTIFPCTGRHSPNRATRPGCHLDFYEWNPTDWSDTWVWKTHVMKSCTWITSLQIHIRNNAFNYLNNVWKY